MAKSILDIIIKLTKQGGADKETVKGLVQVKSAIMEAAAVAGALVAAGYTIKKAFDATVGTMVAYADQVRTISQVSGLSAEESSKLIQMTDDLKISQEELLKVMQKNGDEYDYSVQGLAAMSDQYLALGSSQEKAEFMQKRFGKSWGNFVEAMEQGSRRIKSSAEDINEALILDQAALDSARQYEMELDNLGDTFDAMKISVGNDWLPIISETIGGFNDLNVITERANKTMESGEIAYRRAALAHAAINEALDRQKQRIMDADTARMNGLASLYQTADASKELAATTEEETEALKAASEANQSFMSTLGSVNSTYQSYMNTTKDLEQERMDLEREKQSLLDQGYWAESQQIQDINAKIEENKQKTTEAANQFEVDNKRIMLGYLERKLTADGILDDKEMMWLVEKGVAWGVYHDTAVEETRQMIAEANALINGLVTEKTFTLSLNTLYNTYGDSAQIAGSGARRARGTHGWENVPAGHPTDTYPVWMKSGEQYAVVPPGGSGGNVSVAGAMGGGAVSVTVNINSMVNTADREKVKQELLPVILDGIRSAQAQGMVR